MPSKLATLFVDITGNPAPLQGVLADVKTTLMGFGLAAGAGIAAGIAAGLYKAFEAASLLNSTISRTRVIFGESAGSILAEADMMAEKFGIVKADYIDAAASFGSVFKGMGKSQAEAADLGKSLAQIGLDLASFKGAGASAADAFTALQAALRGEFDPLERFNIFLNAAAIETEALRLGLAKTKGEITDLAKKQAALSLIQKQGVDAAGDLARTAGESDNRFKKLGGTITNLSATIGQALMPAFEALLGSADEALSGISAFVVANKAEITAWAGVVGGAIKGVAFLFMQWARAIGAVAAAIADVARMLGLMGEIAPGAAGRAKVEAAAKAGLGVAGGAPGAAEGGKGARHEGLTAYAQRLQEGIFGKDIPAKQLKVAEDQKVIQQKLLEQQLRHPPGQTAWALATF